MLPWPFAGHQNDVHTLLEEVPTAPVTLNVHRPDTGMQVPSGSKRWCDAAELLSARSFKEHQLHTRRGMQEPGRTCLRTFEKDAPRWVGTDSDGPGKATRQDRGCATGCRGRHATKRGWRGRVLPPGQARRTRGTRESGWGRQVLRSLLGHHAGHWPPAGEGRRRPSQDALARAASRH